MGAHNLHVTIRLECRLDTWLYFEMQATENLALGWFPCGVSNRGHPTKFFISF